MENIGVTTDKGIVFGFYRDLFGQALGQNFSYRVKVQLWYEIIKPTEP